MLMPTARLASYTAGLRCRNRIIEWVCAAMLLNFGATTLLMPQTLANGSFRYILAIGVPPIAFALACSFVAIVRMIALYFNGMGLPLSARVRAVCSIFGAAVFGIMGLSLLYLTQDIAALPLGAGTHFILAAAELYSCLRAGADVVENTHRAVVTGAHKGSSD